MDGLAKQKRDEIVADFVAHGWPLDKAQITAKLIIEGKIRWVKVA